MAAIEILTLANHAEAIDGLLYLSGAGWNELRRQVRKDMEAPPHTFGIALSVIVPWPETNRPHHMRLWIEHEDGGTPIIEAQADLTVGRPPDIPNGSDQRAVMAMNAMVRFPQAGGYRLMARLENGDPKAVSFRVRDVES